MIEVWLPHAVYALCAVTCLLCTLLMFRSWRRTGQRLLFLVGLCFTGLFLNNLLLVTDSLTGPTIDLSTARGIVGLLAMSGLLLAFIWEGL